MKRQRTDADEWDTRIGTGAHSINVVLREAGRPLTLNEILAEVRRRGLPTTNAPERHLYRLEGRQKDRPTAYIKRIGDRWVPLEFTASNDDNVATSQAVNKSELSLRVPTPECDQAAILRRSWQTDRFLRRVARPLLMPVSAKGDSVNQFSDFGIGVAP